MLEVAARHRLGAFALEARFTGEGGLTALFGRSGSGKTTLVNIIAGLVAPEEGRILLDGETLLDTARGIAVPTHRRRIGYVFQEARLFPHLSVRHNLVFGRWFTPRRERKEALEEVVALLGIGHLLARRPASLSGGEKQRVALGRALLAAPRLLLMDEPLASLDAERKAEILPYIERLRDEARIPIVYVSHSLAEVARLATTMVLLSEGRVAATGPVAEVMGRLDLAPQTGRFEAGAVLETRVAAHDEPFALTRLTSVAGEIAVPRIQQPIGAKVRLRIRARDVMIALEPPHRMSALNALPGRVAEIACGDGAQCDLRLVIGAGDATANLLARVTRRSVAELGLAPGREVFAIIKSIAIDRHSLGGSGDGFDEPT